MAQDERKPSSPPVLTGQRVCLRPLEAQDLAHIRRWASDPEIMRLIGEVEPMTQAQAEEFLQRVRTDANRVWFVIAEKQTGRAIGEAGLLRIFRAWRTTDLTIVIGEKDAWGKGHGADAMGLLLDYAFGTLKMHRVAVGVVGFNERALAFYAKSGFRKEGVQRDGYYCDGRYHDFVMMSILEDEYRQIRGQERGETQAGGGD